MRVVNKYRHGLLGMFPKLQVEIVPVTIENVEYHVSGMWTGKTFIVLSCPVLKGIPMSHWATEANRVRGLKEEASVDFEEVNCPFPGQT